MNAPKEPPTLDTIQHLVAKAYGQDIAVMKAPTGDTKANFARHVAMFLALELRDLTRESIAAAFGDFDGAELETAEYGIELYLRSHPSFEIRIQELIRMILSAN